MNAKTKCVRGYRVQDYTSIGVPVILNFTNIKKGSTIYPQIPK